MSLSDYVLQPPDGTPPGGNEGDDEGDTTIFEGKLPTTPETPTTGGQPGQQNRPPSFGAPDTTGRLDSLSTLPTAQPAPIETIGGQTGRLLPGGPAKQPVKSKRGVLGLHPAALLAAMIAMHILVVGLVTK